MDGDFRVGSRDEALVLFDWLSRFTGSGAFDSLSPAEQRVLWNLEAGLEKALSEVVGADYGERVSAARSRIASAEEDGSSDG